MNDIFAYVHARPNTVDAMGVFYVGKGSKNRSSWFYKRNAHHSNIVNKYGKNNILIGRLQCSTETQAFELEKGLIKCFRRMGVSLSNMTDGGEGAKGHRHTEESKQLLSLASKLRSAEIIAQNKLVHTGRKCSAETRLKMKLASTGVLHCEEAKLKMSIYRQGSRWMFNGSEVKQVTASNVENHLKDGWLFGRKVSNKEITHGN